MPSPILNHLDSIVQDYTAGDLSEGQALAQIRHAVGRPVSPDLIADATACWSDVCDFQPGGGRDWRAYLERERVAGDGPAAALEHAEDEYGWALMALARGGERRMGVAV